jgi:hypothetical protein
METLHSRFDTHPHHHPHTKWEEVEKRLLANPDTLAIIERMEATGGEPDVIELSDESSNIYFVDCSPESPVGRRSLCYDRVALDGRKENKPKNNVEDMAKEIGVALLTEEEYATLQTFDNFDMKTSSWIATPVEVRKLGGALFGDRRYDRVFTYHNGADSYYAARGFRGKVLV